MNEFGAWGWYGSMVGLTPEGIKFLKDDGIELENKPEGYKVTNDYKNGMIRIEAGNQSISLRPGHYYLIKSAYN